MANNASSRHEGQLLSPSLAPEVREELLRWYMQQHVPDPKRGYAQMNPPGADGKYSRKKQTLTPMIIERAFDGAVRRLQIAATWVTFPLSIAVVPQNVGGMAREIAIDIDTGGEAAMRQVLACCAEMGLWAYAQLGESRSLTGTHHDGGHLHLPFDRLTAASFLQNTAVRLLKKAGVQGEVYPSDCDLRLPLMTHLWAPGGARRFPLMLPSGEPIDASDPWVALARLREVWGG